MSRVKEIAHPLVRTVAGLQHTSPPHFTNTTLTTFTSHPYKPLPGQSRCHGEGTLGLLLQCGCLPSLPEYHCRGTHTHHHIAQAITATYQAMTEHSMCQPGLPSPHGLGHAGSPPLLAFQRAKSLGPLFSPWVRALSSPVAISHRVEQCIRVRPHGLTLSLGQCCEVPHGLWH